MTQVQNTPVLLGPQIGDEPHVNQNGNYTFTIRSYVIGASVSGRTAASALSQGVIDCYPTETADNTQIFARIHFVTSTDLRWPWLYSGKGIQFYEVFMHATLMPMVLRQLQVPGCMFVFENKTEPHARIDTLPSSTASLP